MTDKVQFYITEDKIKILHYVGTLFLIAFIPPPFTLHSHWLLFYFSKVFDLYNWPKSTKYWYNLIIFHWPYSDLLFLNAVFYKISIVIYIYHISNLLLLKKYISTTKKATFPRCINNRFSRYLVYKFDQ